MSVVGDRFAVIALDAATQWGMFTAAQARAVGLTYRQLGALVRRGTLTHVSRGVYRIVGTPDDVALDDLRAAWLTTSSGWVPEGSTEPVTAISHLCAAHTVYGLGTVRSDMRQLTVPEPRRTRSRDLELHTARLGPADWQIVDGLPVTTIARSIADIYVDHVDGGHLGDIVRDALEIAVAPAAEVIAALDAVTDGNGRALVVDCLHQSRTPPYVLAGNEMLTRHRRRLHTAMP